MTTNAFERLETGRYRLRLRGYKIDVNVIPGKNRYAVFVDDKRIEEKGGINAAKTFAIKYVERLPPRGSKSDLYQEKNLTEPKKKKQEVVEPQAQIPPTPKEPLICSFTMIGELSRATFEEAEGIILGVVETLRTHGIFVTCEFSAKKMI